MARPPIDRSKLDDDYKPVIKKRHFVEEYTEGVPPTVDFSKVRTPGKSISITTKDGTTRRFDTELAKALSMDADYFGKKEKQAISLTRYSDPKEAKLDKLAVEVLMNDLQLNASKLAEHLGFEIQSVIPVQTKEGWTLNLNICKSYKAREKLGGNLGSEPSRMEKTVPVKTVIAAATPVVKKKKKIKEEDLAVRLKKRLPFLLGKKKPR